MKSTAVSSRLIASATCAAAFLFIIAFSPVSASAQTTPGSAQTGELIPPGQNTCQAVSITSIQPYVYDGVLESFDVTISDASNSYVGVSAEVGNSPIPFTFITRWAGVPNGLKIHVDTPDTTVNGVLPVTLTLLSSPPNAPTCITTVSFAVSSAQSVPLNSNSSQPVSGGYPASTSITYPSTSVQNSAPTSSGVSSSAKPSTTTHQGTGSGTSTATAMASVSNSSFFSSVCSGTNAFRLWFVLLIIYVIIVAIVVFAEPWFLESSVIASTAVILVPLILLLAFWYLSPSCRAASWIPVVACIIAIIGLFLAFREYELPPLLPAGSEQ